MLTADGTAGMCVCVPFLQLLLFVDTVCSCLPGAMVMCYVMWTANCGTCNMQLLQGGS